MHVLPQHCSAVQLGTFRTRVTILWPCSYISHACFWTFQLQLSPLRCVQYIESKMGFDWCTTFQRMPNTSSPTVSLPKPIPSSSVPSPHLRSPMDDGNSAPAKKQSLKQDDLTSIDFYNDFSSSIRGQMSKLRDRAKVEAFKEAIDRVKHLVRGKVAFFNPFLP